MHTKTCLLHLAVSLLIGNGDLLICIICLIRTLYIFLCSLHVRDVGCWARVWLSAGCLHAVQVRLPAQAGWSAWQCIHWSLVGRIHRPRLPVSSRRAAVFRISTAIATGWLRMKLGWISRVGAYIFIFECVGHRFSVEILAVFSLACCVYLSHKPFNSDAFFLKHWE